MYSKYASSSFSLNIGGDEGSRTPVRKPIHCTSTSLANCLTFPPPDLNQHNSGFSRL
nr:MAG TPA: hypothetical protein [Caudoviricetes sp.]